MLTEEDVFQLKKKHFDLKKRIETFGEEQFKNIIELTQMLQELIDEVEKVKKQKDEIGKKSLIDRIKTGKRSAKLYKKLSMFESDINYEINRNGIPADVGKKMIEIVGFLKTNKTEYANYLFGYFTELLNLNSSYIKNQEELSRQKELIEKELKKTEKLLKDIETISTVTIDANKVDGYRKYQSDLNRLNELRSNYIRSLLNERIPTLIKKIDEDCLMEFGFPKIEGDELKRLETFFQKDKFFSEMTVPKLCEMFEYSEEKIKHIYPAVSDFKRTVLSNRLWFESIRNLENTQFAMFELNSKMKKFYTEKVPGAAEVISRIEKYEPEVQRYREEYEKNNRYLLEKERLAKYSKQELEEELRSYKRMLDLLQTETEDVLNSKYAAIKKDVKDERKTDNLPKTKGILSSIKSLLGLEE